MDKKKMDLGDINAQENNRKQDIEEKRVSQTVYANFKLSALIWLFAATIFVSSLFGGIFGFMSAGIVTIFSSKVSQEVHKFFPFFNLAVNDSGRNKQQVIVEDSAVIDVVKKASPSVVSIVISKNIPNIQGYFNGSGGFFDPFSANIPGLNGNQQNGGSSQNQTIGGGSGFLITTDGMILTNRHVVDDRQATYTVVTSDGKKYDAKILARDPVRDVAVIKIDGTNLPVVSLGDSDSLQIGQTTIAIGNSLGEFSNSVSRGIVSGLKRNLTAGSAFGDSERLTDIIQTDAAINPGNSGGPLLDIEGNVIGLNVAVAEGAQNIGFALPINQAKRIVDQVKNGTKISVPYLGVRYIVIDSAVKNDARLQFDYGVLVLRGSKVTDLAVIPGSPADKAGITENDIILEVNGQKIDVDNQLGDLVAKYKVGETISLKVWHKGSLKDVQVILQESM